MCLHVYSVLPFRNQSSLISASLSNVVSSAYKIDLRHVVYVNQKRKTPNTDPCGTPILSAYQTKHHSPQFSELSL